MLEILNSLIVVIKIIGLAWFITRFEPIEWILESMKSKNYLLQLIIDIVNVILTCMKCSAFWIGLIFSGSIWIALLASYVSLLYEKIIGPWEKQIILNYGKKE